MHSAFCAGTRGTRPGHQRHATLAQVLTWQPTFLVAFHGPAANPAADVGFWATQGYAWVRAPMENELTLLFLARRERADEIVARGSGTIVSER